MDDPWARSMAGTVESPRPGKGGAWYRRGGLRWGGMMGGNGWFWAGWKLRTWWGGRDMASRRGQAEKLPKVDEVGMVLMKEG